MSAFVLALAALAAPLPAPQAPTFGVSVESVYVDVFVTDGGAPVLGLTAVDFELKDDGRRQEVEIAGTEEMPLTTLLVLDTSGSVAGEKLEQLREGVRAVLRARGAADTVGLVTFDQEIRVRVPPGSDPALVERALAAAQPGGATALYDALYAGTVLASDRGRSLVVVFTDGEDNLSWLDARAVARVLEVSNVLVQVVGIGAPDVSEPVSNVARGSYGDIRRSPAPEPPHVGLLRRLAESTGGRFWPAGKPRDIAAAFEAMVAAMKTRYVLRFDPGHAHRAGRHEVEVKLRKGRRGKVHCRKAYFAAPRVGSDLELTH
jgi:VWFA-related protein